MHSFNCRPSACSISQVPVQVYSCLNSKQTTSSALCALLYLKLLQLPQARSFSSRRMHPRASCLRRTLPLTAFSALLQVRARDLFYGLWVNDLFMRRVEANAEWSLFCPNEAPGLAECWGEAFDALYQRFEREGRAKRTIKAQQLWFAILEAQVGLTTSAIVCFSTVCSSIVCLL